MANIIRTNYEGEKKTKAINNIYLLAHQSIFTHKPKKLFKKHKKLPVYSVSDLYKQIICYPEVQYKFYPMIWKGENNYKIL